MKPVHFLLLILAFSGAVVTYNYLYQSAIEEAEQAMTQQVPEKEEKRRPDFTMTDIEGLPRSVSEWDGAPLIINFWASWCEPCRREIPDFIDLQRQYKARGLQMLGIALEERQAVNEYLATMAEPFNYPILAGADEAFDVATDYGNGMGILPFTVGVDRQGNIVQLQYGEFRRKDIEALIERLLR